MQAFEGTDVVLGLSAKEAGMLAVILDLVEFNGKSQVARFAQDLQDVIYDLSDEARDVADALQNAEVNQDVPFASVKILFPRNAD